MALVNEETISHAEHSCLFLEGCSNVTFVGTPTNGANGNVTNMQLPGILLCATQFLISSSKVAFWSGSQAWERYTQMEASSSEREYNPMLLHSQPSKVFETVRTRYLLQLCSTSKRPCLSPRVRPHSFICLIPMSLLGVVGGLQKKKLINYDWNRGGGRLVTLACMLLGCCSMGIHQIWCQRIVDLLVTLVTIHKDSFYSKSE